MPYTRTTQADLVVDTTNAPWMAIAKGELSKGVHEVQRYENFKAPLARSLAQNAPRGPALLDWNEVNKSLLNRFPGPWDRPSSR